MSVIVREEVLEANMVSGPHRSFSAENSSFFAAISSMMASITRCRSARSERSVEKRRRLHAASRSASVSLPLSTARSSDLRIRSRPPSISSSLTSRTTTSKPAFAATSAMPLPMSPHPTTPTVSMTTTERPRWGEPRRQPPPPGLHRCRPPRDRTFHLSAGARGEGGW